MLRDPGLNNLKLLARSMPNRGRIKARGGFQEQVVHGNQDQCRTGERQEGPLPLQMGAKAFYIDVEERGILK